MNITKDILYVGVNDREIDLFEGQYVVPNGMAYNSYVIADDKVAVMDSVDRRFADEWIKNIEAALGEREPDYLVVQHMEPDHSSSVSTFVDRYPGATIVASQKAFAMMQGFFGNDFKDRRLVVGEGSTLELGKHTLKFITAPMVHWPEVIVTYDSYDKVLFSADGFGKFGALDADEEWACEARRYYFGIVGKYGAQVQSLLSKASALDIEVIAPLHGPVLNANLSYYLSLYDTWSSYRPEVEGVFIAYTSVYGNTREAVGILRDELTARGIRVSVADLAREDMAEAVEDAFKYSHLILATTTYNGDVFPYMRTFIDALTERSYKKRTVSFVENGSWAPMATKVMRAMLEGSKDITYTERGVRITSAVSEATKDEIKALADEIKDSFN